MRIWIAVICFVAGLQALFWGIKTEYEQSRADGPVAMVATLPFGVAAAMLLTMGSAWAWPGLSLLALAGIFIGAAAAGVTAVGLASKRRG